MIDGEVISKSFFLKKMKLFFLHFYLGYGGVGINFSFKKKINENFQNFVFFSGWVGGDWGGGASKGSGGKLFQFFLWKMN